MSDDVENQSSGVVDEPNGVSKQDNVAGNYVPNCGRGQGPEDAAEERLLKGQAREEEDEESDSSDDYDEVFMRHADDPNDFFSTMEKYLNGSKWLEDDRIKRFAGFISCALFLLVLVLVATTKPPKDEEGVVSINEEFIAEEFTPTIPNLTNHVNLAPSHIQPIALVHYHKTGMKLTRIFSKYLSHGSQPTWALKKIAHFAKRSSNLDVVKYLPRNGAAILGGAIIEQRPPTYNGTVLHFARNPFRMAVSSYLYHSQKPTPELWVINADPCEFTRDITEGFADNLGVASSQIDDVLAMCNKLYNNSGKRYYHELRTLDAYDGLRLETTRIILGGDLLRMGSNSKNLEEHWPWYLQMCLDDTMADPKQAMVNVGRAIKKNFTQAALIRFEKKETKVGHYVGDLHVTSNLADAETKNEWMTKLRNDPVLGPILSIVEERVGCSQYV